jgi:hypothetical protein
MLDMFNDLNRIEKKYMVPTYCKVKCGWMIPAGLKKRT